MVSNIANTDYSICTQVSGFKYNYLTLIILQILLTPIILLNINHVFVGNIIFKRPKLICLHTVK